MTFWPRTPPSARSSWISVEPVSIERQPPLTGQPPLKVRPFSPDDIGRLCGLVDADRLPGQPPCTLDAVTAVLGGRSKTCAWWWEQLETMRVAAAESPTGELLGAGAVGRAAERGARYLLWLHAREEPVVLDGLLNHLFRGARRIDPIHAFAFATDFTVGLEGIPRTARAATHDALLRRGFAGDEGWLYLHAADPGPAPAIEYRCRGGTSDIRVEVLAAGTVVGGIEVTVTGPGLGVLWWLEIDAAHRGRGLGRQLLRAARHVLAAQGTTETILYVDRDESGGWRPALALYLSEGYRVVDHLWSYHRGTTPEGAAAT